MRTINIRQIEAHLSRLVEDTAGVEALIIAKAGRPVATLVPLDGADTINRGRVGFYDGPLTMPPDFDRLAEDEIVALFEGMGDPARR